MKICKTCHLEKPLRAFYRNRRSHEGSCKECRKAYMREMHWLKRETILARKRIWSASPEQRAKRAAYQRSERGKQVKRETYRFARLKLDTPRVSRGLISPGKVMTDRGVRRPVAISVASSSRTRPITGAACGAETRYHESRADLHGVTGNAGTMGRGSISP